jgi:hypothetical protein
MYEADQGLASAARQHDKARSRAAMRKHLGERLLLIRPVFNVQRVQPNPHISRQHTHITTPYRGIYTALARPNGL